MMTVVILAALFTGGVVTGIVGLVCVSIGREESGNSLYRKPPTAGAAATRWLLGWHGPVRARTRPSRTTFSQDRQQAPAGAPARCA